MLARPTVKQFAAPTFLLLIFLTLGVLLTILLAILMAIPEISNFLVVYFYFPGIPLYFFAICLTVVHIENIRWKAVKRFVIRDIRRIHCKRTEN
jgi:hypothetical protein